MAQLGSIYGSDGGDSGPRGPDLKHTVTVRRGALRHQEGVLQVVVPEALADATGELVRRQPDPVDGGYGPITLRLPADLPSGAILRLRKQGGDASSPDGRAGDLLVQVLVDERQPLPTGWVTVALVLFVFAAASLLWLALG